MLSTVATGARATAPAVAVVAQGTAAAATAVAASSTRGMATLRDMQQRLTSLENMGKITASMKMVAAAKLRQAERFLDVAQSYGSATQVLADRVGIPEDTEVKKSLILGVTTDRGLCGGVNSQLVKEMILQFNAATAEGKDVEFALLGEKGRAILKRAHGDKISLIFNEFGKAAFSYGQASYIADTILDKLEFDTISVVSNKYVSIISYEQQSKTMLSPTMLDEAKTADPLVAYQRPGTDISNYGAFALANVIYAATMENIVVEQSARMNAMESASKNAAEMEDVVRLAYNRQRQAVITRELIEIISGAAAL